MYGCRGYRQSSRKYRRFFGLWLAVAQRHETGYFCASRVSSAFLTASWPRGLAQARVTRQHSAVTLVRRPHQRPSFDFGAVCPCDQRAISPWREKNCDAILSATGDGGPDCQPGEVGGQRSNGVAVAGVSGRLATEDEWIHGCVCRLLMIVLTLE
jgi:hypothetical protein